MVETVAGLVVRTFEVVVDRGVVVRLDPAGTETMEAPPGTMVGAGALVTGFTGDEDAGEAMTRADDATEPILIGQNVVYNATISVVTDPIFAGQFVTVAAQLVIV